MKIQFSDLGAQHKEIGQQIRQAISRVIKRSDFILGEDVGLLEKEFSYSCGSKYAVGVSSGTAALFLALASLDISQGDEVIVPDFTYIATALAVSYTGARPIFVDIEESTYNIDVAKIKKAITPKTKAIIPVHLFGQPANMPEILKIAKEHNLKVIEDAAQAHGARIKISAGAWKVVGSIGDIGCFSFYPSKNLGALGDGGMIVTNNKVLYKKLLMLRDYGRVSKYEHAMIGYNSRLDTLQAAILRIKLKKLEKWNRLRQKAAKIYEQYLKGRDGVTLPYASKSVKHVYHVYPIRIKRRNEIYEQLRKNGVGVIIHYPIPLHLQKAYSNLRYRKGEFPVSEKVAREIISLPMHPFLKRKQIRYVAKIISAE